MNKKTIAKLAAWKLLGDMSCSKCVYKYTSPIPIKVTHPKDNVNYMFILCYEKQDIPMAENSSEERLKIIMTSRCENYLEEPDD